MDAETSTRDRVARAVGEHGPVTASALAARLGLTAAAVRRHLDAMLADGRVEVLEAPAPGRRGRGRPARAFVLTDRGHDRMPAAYDDLAVSALRYLAAAHGPDAVEAFARSRVEALEERYAEAVREAGDDVAARADALARALSDDGYAASTRPLAEGTPRAATQLCQGHCPVAHVAAEFPQFCEAETRAFGRLLGVHVQRLATLAAGAHVCTTHVPRPAAPATTSAATTSPGTTSPGTTSSTTSATTPQGRNGL